jgi:anaerobic selenocysteine-containing dehydrogenase
MVSKTAVLRGLAPQPFIEMNDADVKTLELADGDEVVVAADGFEGRAVLRIADVAQGAVFVPYSQAGLPVNRLLAGNNRVVEVRPA